MKKSFILLVSIFFILTGCNNAQNPSSPDNTQNIPPVENPNENSSGGVDSEEPSVIPGSESGSAMGTGEEIFPEEIVYESGMKVTSGGYVGLEENDAMQIAKENNTPFRVVERDGESLPVTEDYAKGRINASVKEGEIVSYTIE